jgi:riboflavin synthase
MFTGIIEGLGTIAGMRPSGQGKRLSLDADFSLEQTKIGDSISVNGACLTVIKLDGKHLEFDVSPETLDKTTFGLTKVGDRVNLERAMRLSDRIDGHLVSGHIDGMGTITQRENLANAIIVTIGVPESLTRYIITKGSVAVDGISLTINALDAKGFTVSIIPHTAQLATIGFKKRGDRVNIETDMIGKYVERFVGGNVNQTEEAVFTKKRIDIEFLAQKGFVK